MEVREGLESPGGVVWSEIVSFFVRWNWSGLFSIQQKFWYFRAQMVRKCPRQISEKSKKIVKLPKSEPFNQKFRKFWHENQMKQKLRVKNYGKYLFSPWSSSVFSGNVASADTRNFRNANRNFWSNGMLSCFWLVFQIQIAETRVLIMEDMLVFLQEKDQKYSLLSLDQKVRDFFLMRQSRLFSGDSN